MQINDPKPLLFDGAFGTYYYNLTGDSSPCEQACLTAPDTILGIHREYLAAGARAIATNTFAANPHTQPDESHLRKILEAGLALARQAAADYPDARVFADIGGIVGDTAEQDYRKTTEILVSLGADCFLFETLAELEPLLPALEWLRDTLPEAVVYVSFAVSEDGYTQRGLYYRTLLTACADNPAIDAAGLNCSCGPSHMLALLQKLPAMKKPLIAMSNAGYPSTLNGRLYFEDNSDYFAEKAAAMYAAGADIIGGCCGTTPRHIALVAKRLSHAPKRPQKNAPDPENRHSSAPRLSVKKKLIAVEIDPPQTPDCTHLTASAARLAQMGVDWITMADSPLARARANSIMAAAKVRRETGVRVLPHMSCRDRNTIGIKAALLGAAMEGIEDLLIITGDSPADCRAGVFQFHAASLMGYISDLNAELFSARPFRLAGALNVNAHNFHVELERAKSKLQNGASMLLTQPIFSERAMENLSLAHETLHCTLLAGILPVAGYKNARFLANEVTGIVIPPDFLEHLRTSTPEEARILSVEFAAGIAKRCYPLADGFYIMTPLRKTEIVCDLLERIYHFENEGVNP